MHDILNMFKKKMTIIAYVFLEIEIAKDVVSKMSKKIGFKRPFDSQHARDSQALL